MSNTVTMYTHDDLDVLAGVLRERLLEPREHVLEQPWIVVPSAGIRQWLDMELAKRFTLGPEHPTAPGQTFDGVSANFRYLFPEELVRELETRALATQNTTRHAWDATSTTLRIRAAHPELEFAECQRLGTELDRLIRWRPDLLTSGEHANVALYRELVATWGDPVAQRSDALAALRSGSVALANRLFLFGHIGVPGGKHFAELISTTAFCTPVYVFHPFSPSDVATTPQHASNVARWGAYAHDVRTVWQNGAPNLEIVDLPASPRESASLLTRLQAFVRHPGRDAETGSTDDSVAIYGAYGKTRQVQVLRDALLGIIASTPDIKAHDILVLTNDLDGYAPLLERHWKPSAENAGAVALPFTFAEVPTARYQSRYDASVAFLTLLESRVTRFHMENFLAMPVVARCLGLSASDLERLWTLAATSRVTLGTSPQQRARFDVFADSPDGMVGSISYDTGTWQRLVDRLARTMVFDLPTQENGATALDSLTGLAAVGIVDDLTMASRILGLLNTIDCASIEIAPNKDGKPSPTRPLSEWLTELDGWFTAALTNRTNDESFERTLLRARASVHEGADPSLSFQDFHLYWAGLGTASTRPTVYGHRGATVASTSALAGVPYKVVAFLGFDAENLPIRRFGDELPGRNEVGDPDPKASSYAGILANILAARSHLVVTYTAHSESTGDKLDPSISLDELREDLSECLDGTPDGFEFTMSSRHPFSHPAGVTEKFVTTTMDPRFSWFSNGLPEESLDQTTATELTNARADERHQELVLDVETLSNFLNNPQRAHLRAGVGMRLPDPWPDEQPYLNATLNPLEQSIFRKKYAEFVINYLDRNPTHHVGDVLGRIGEIQVDDAYHTAFMNERNRWLSLAQHDETFTRGIPELLWRDQVKLPTVDLFAFNYVLDMEAFSPVGDIAMPTVEIDFGADAPNRFSEFFNPPTTAQPGKVVISRTTWNPPIELGGLDRRNAQLFIDNSGLAHHITADPARAPLALVDTSFGGKPNLERRLWQRFVRLAALKVQFPERSVTSYCFSPPDKTSPWTGKRVNTFMSKGHLRSNPVVVMQFTGTTEEAKDVLRTVASLYVSNLDEAIPFAPKTLATLFAPFAEVSNDGVSDSSPTWDGTVTNEMTLAKVWEDGYQRVGEGSDPERRLLMPYDFDALVSLSSERGLPYWCLVLAWARLTNLRLTQNSARAYARAYVAAVEAEGLADDPLRLSNNPTQFLNIKKDKES